MKNRLILALTSVAALSWPAFASASQWDVDPAHTTAGFSVKHMVINTVRGEFGKTTGTVNLDDADPTKSTVELTIDASSVDTRNADRDKHLKTQDFFWVDKYPTLTFKSTKIEKKDAEHYSVTGDLTMRGVTKPVTLDVVMPAQELKDPWGATRRAATATGTINRQDWGINWNKGLDNGGVLVSNDVGLEVDVEMTKKAPDAGAKKGAK